ncbi:MAG: AIR synthase related protein [Bdellovibrionota bacterium]
MTTEKLNTHIFALKANKVPDWKDPGQSLSFIILKSNDKEMDKKIKNLFGKDIVSLPAAESQFLFRCYMPGVSNPVAESLARVLKVPSKNLRIDQALEITTPLSDTEFKNMEALWREPAIETLRSLSFADYLSWLEKLRTPERSDNSFDAVKPEDIGLEFSPEERQALDDAAQKEGRSWNRAEWELFAQTWSEHCKHKIFNAEISLTEENVETNSIFKSKLRVPALAETEKKPELFLSLFHDNAGVLRIYNPAGEGTDMAIAAKMETHNSPSAISPYGGASTGVVGVHRDILGTGLGALPVANWDVLCFESPEHSADRPATALSPEIIRRGVLRGIQDGGNQSGIPTVQGSVVFDPSYAVKPLVFAGALGILPTKYVNKHPKGGDTLFVIGGATGADGLRGAVMSSRDIRSEDFSGSIVQVANPYTQRCLTDFLMEARDKDLLTAVTDNGAGGLASSVGEMSTLTGGATIDLSNIRLKFDGLLEWEKLLSESQERMTLATDKPEELKTLLKQWRIEFDELGTLNTSGRLVVTTQNKKLIDLSLEVLHDLCPQMKLKSFWSFEKEKAALQETRAAKKEESLDLKSFNTYIQSPDWASREKILRRFDHEVQGRTLRKPFAGATQESPTEGSLIEIPEAKSYIALGHGLCPKEDDFALGLLNSFDEAMKRYLLSSGQLKFAALLDNYSWPDPLKNDRSLWKLELSGEILKLITQCFGTPFVSGKDSMKNNDAKFRILETLVISVFGSARGPEYAPTSFFTKSGLKIYNWQPTPQELTLKAESRSDLVSKTTDQLQKLKTRYELIEKWISEKKLISAKDYSALVPLKSLFEMSLGRKIGFTLNEGLEKQLQKQGTLGAFHLVFDPAFDPLSEHPELKNELILVGSTADNFETLKEFRSSYIKAGENLLWA